MRLILCPACAGRFDNKTQKTIHQIADKCQGGCQSTVTKTKRRSRYLLLSKPRMGVTVRTQTRFQDHPYHADGYEIYWKWRYAAGVVTHWMPLPKPPEEQQYG